MFKRLILIGLLGLSLVVWSRTEATAQGACEPTLLALYGICVVMEIDDPPGFVVEAGSVKVDSILKKLQNANTTKPSYEVVLFLQQVSARCTNPGGQSENAQGNPHNVDVSISETQAINAAAVTKNGKFLSDIEFTDADLIAALAPVLGNVCKPNWSLRKIAVNKMQVFGTLFSCANGGDQSDPRNLVTETGDAGPCEVQGFPGVLAIADALGKQCVVPAGQNVFQTPFKYDCAAPAPGGTLCQGVPGSGPAACPQPPVLLPEP